jgi:hypothetical protein
MSALKDLRQTGLKELRASGITGLAYEKLLDKLKYDKNLLGVDKAMRQIRASKEVKGKITLGKIDTILKADNNLKATLKKSTHAKKPIFKKNTD